MASKFSSCNQWTHEWAQKNEVPSYFLDETDSTNTWAKKSFAASDRFAIFLTDSQTQGRGRYDRKWFNSEPGSTLLSTWCLTSSAGPQPILSSRIGLKIYQSLKTVFPNLPLSLKAPNDIWLGSGKLLGLLIEIESSGQMTHYFIGIGLNVFAKPKGLGIATANLSESTMVSREHWNRLCHLLHVGLCEIGKDPSRENLLEIEKKQLLEALNLHPTENYTSIDSHGNLVRKDGSLVRWSEL